MGAFSDIFGKVPKVLLLEMFAENPDDELTASDVIYQTEISKRAVYYLLQKYVDEGLIISIKGRPNKFRLNYNDLRALALKQMEPVMIMGKLEAELKIDQNISLEEPYYNINNNIDIFNIEEQEQSKNNDIKQKSEYENLDMVSEPAGA